MNRSAWRRSSTARWSLALRSALALAWTLIATPVSAQELDLPSPEPTFIPASRNVQVVWREVPQTEGRRARISSLSNWDADSSSVIEIVGDYLGDCDFRLRLEKIAEDDGFGLHLRLLAKLFDSDQAIGAAIGIDTVDVFEPNVAYAIDPALAPDLSIRLSPTVNPPSTPLGSIPVTVGGMNTSLARTSTYVVRALNTVVNFPTGSDSLVVRVAGPTTVNDSTVVPLNAQRVDTLVVRSTTDVLPIFNGMTISFGSGSASAGQEAQWSARYAFSQAGSISVDLESFHGYHIWRADLPNLDSFTLLGEIRICESKGTLALLNEEEVNASDVDLDYDPSTRTFRFTDFDVHDDFPYRYAVSTFDTGFLGNQQGVVDEGVKVASAKFYPGASIRNPNDKVYVVPNPYLGAADWEEDRPKVVFANLPERCTIRVFTEATDLLATLLHGPDQSRTTSPTTATWDLKTDSGEALVSGVYIFHVEAPNFEQLGKMMVAR